jgi:hypothetical protein
MSNLAGKAYALSVLSPLKPWTTWLNQVILLRGRLQASDNSDLKKLTFIHYARWQVVCRHDWLGEPPGQVKYNYLLFFSNFNGTWDQYIDAFSDVVPSGLNLIWRWSVKFPGSVPVTPFKDYIRLNQYDTDYYYNAYPGAATTDVRAAIFLKESLAKFAEVNKDLEPAAFKLAYNKFLISVQNSLMSTGAGPRFTERYHEASCGLKGGQYVN